MIQVKLGGRVRLHEGPASRLEVDSYYRVMAGTQWLPRPPRPFGSTHIIEMVPGVTYNILKPESRGPTMTRFIVATVMLDHEGKVWVGPPTDRQPARDGDPTAWNRILDFEIDERT